MKLIDALNLANRRGSGGNPRRVWLVCGFTPLHLAAFFKAHLQVHFSNDEIQLKVGLFGDTLGSLASAAQDAPDSVGVVLEWPDLDSRLDIRSSGAWHPDSLNDILLSAESVLERFKPALAKLSSRCPVALFPPTLPLPPVSHFPGWRLSPFEARLRELLAGFLVWAQSQANVRVAREQRINLRSAAESRRDTKLELYSGFPYQQAHADALAEMLVQLLYPPPPLKGLITDLDDTLWRGILGEVGVSGVTWELAQHAHIHAVYQRLLASLAQAGVLVGAASKNDAALVAQALSREDILIPKDLIFPVHAHWGPKSESVGAILKAWNVAADSVAYVDDSPMELAEVRNTHPAVEGLLFQKDDAVEVLALLERLRDRFGKDTLTEEDRIRAASLRTTAATAQFTGEVSSEFLAQIQPVVTFDFRKDPSDKRAFDLVNKTNQFNLNGRRYTEAEWQSCLGRPDTFMACVSYQDKFGPLGKIALVLGENGEGRLLVHTWVMSCRAFSRQIEHRVLKELFSRFAPSHIEFRYTETPRNGPLRNFLGSFVPRPFAEPLAISARRFGEICPSLPHEVKETSHA